MTKRTTADVLSVNTILYTARFEPCVKFYGSLPGFESTFSNDWFVEFRVGGGGCVSVADAGRTSVDAGGPAGLTLTFQVKDADEIHARLTALGMSATTPRNHPWGARTFFVYDPDDRRLEFWSSSSS